MFVAFINGAYVVSSICASQEAAVNELIEDHGLESEDIERIQIAEVLPIKVKLPIGKFVLE